MAILASLPGVEITVHVDGQPLKEYSYPGADTSNDKVCCYIEAVSGKEFEIHCKVHAGTSFQGDMLSCQIWIEDVWAGGSILEKSACGPQGCLDILRGYRSSCPEKARAFIFSAIETAEDGKMRVDEVQMLEKKGGISVQVNHANLGQPGAQWTGADIPSESSIKSEKALKGSALTHEVEAGRSITVEKSEMLKSMLIIPRTPSPIPLEERDVESLSLDELRQLQLELKEAKEQTSRVKRERIEADEETHPRSSKKTRPTTSSTQFEIDDDGELRQSSTCSLLPPPAEKVVIKLDD